MWTLEQGKWVPVPTPTQPTRGYVTMLPQHWFEEGLEIAEQRTNLRRPKTIAWDFYRHGGSFGYTHEGFTMFRFGYVVPDCRYRLADTDKRLFCQFVACHEFGHYWDFTRLGGAKGYERMYNLFTEPKCASEAEYVQLPSEQSANAFALDMLKHKGLTNIEQVFYL